ncbi:MAG: pyrimidine 5'-nucleotidase [Caulobacterales bacterium]
MSADLRHIRDWVFDLDNTLYDPAADLFKEIDARMADYVARLLKVDLAEAKRLQKLYYVDHGTTLAGLMRLHEVDPHDYLEYVHDIELSALEPNPRLAAAIARLPGRRFVFTNGSRGHAERVLDKLALNDLFSDLFDIVAADFTPKPHADAFTRLLDRHIIDPKQAVLFEDLERNLQTAQQLGFTTVLVTSSKDWSHEPAGVRPAALDTQSAFADHITDDLTGFLERAAIS